MAGGGREELAELATQEGVVDLIVPRGGEGLKAALKGVATVPVIYAASGNCHVYVDASADLDAAAADRRSTPRRSGPGVCNAAETLLVHADVAPAFLPRVLGALREAGVELRVDGRTHALAGEALAGTLADATDEDWDTEFLALILAVGIVDSVEEAIAHVNAHGSGHSEAIVTDSAARGARLRARRRRRLRLRQRLDALHRRRRVRHGRRDRQLDPEAARARADRAARAVHLQVRRPRRRARQGLRRPAPRFTAPSRMGHIGILGGTFNPPHMGHLVMAQEALDQLDLERVVLLPVARAAPQGGARGPGRRPRASSSAGSPWPATSASASRRSRSTAEARPSRSIP